jgi:hypothetical protein
MRRTAPSLLALSLGLAWFGAACDAPSTDSPRLPSVEPTSAPCSGVTFALDPAAIPLLQEGQGEASVVPHPFRARQRMNVDQLKAAIAGSLGGYVWMEGQEDRLEALAPTLGRPDYVESTREDLTPSLVFVKFLEDLANDACVTIVGIEYQTTSADERTLVTLMHPNDDPYLFPDEVTATIQDLVRRFHGRNLADGSAELERWRKLLLDAHDWTFAELSSPDMPIHFLGWRDVCIVLITHPDFYTY